MRRNLSRILLVAFSMCLVLSAAYVAVTSLATRSSAVPVRDYRYASARESAINAQAVQDILTSLGQTMSPDQLTTLRGRLAGVSHSPAQSDALGQYVGTLLNFSANMNQIQIKLSDAQSSLASGDTKQATSDYQQLTTLRNETESLLHSLTILLDRVTAQQGINSTAQQQKLSDYGALLQTYSGEIDQLGVRLQAQEGYILTILTLNASGPLVFINQSLALEGSLKDQNGTALSMRSVEIGWGTTQTVLVETNIKGRFGANISFPIGFSAGLARVEAQFTPAGNDINLYTPSTAAIYVEVAYQPTRIAAEISSARLRPLDTASVQGNLSTQTGDPLESKRITVQIDETNIGNLTTGNGGHFSFAFPVPQTLYNGTHVLTVAFPANGEAFGPSNATLQFVIEIVGTRSIISTTRNSLFSATSLAVNGSIAYNNNTAVTGTNVTIFFDNVAFANVTIGEDGSFHAVIQVPIWTSFGVHSVVAKYESNRPWVQSSEAAADIFVYTTPLVLMAAVSVSAAISAGVYLSRRSRRRTSLPLVPLPEAVVVQQPTEERLSPEDLISAIKAEDLPAARIRKSYTFAQTMINQKVGESSRIGETHWEYYSRVTKSIPQVSDTLKRLTDLYELAEYTSHPIEPAQSREASEILLQLREEIETVK
jgi:hypothetical protein